MTVIEWADGLRLEHPDEPVELLAKLRQSHLYGDDAPSGAGDDSSLGVWLWTLWRGALEPMGVDRETFMEIVAGYFREQWLWIVGDRRWGPFLEGLAGRVARRLPAR